MDGRPSDDRALDFIPGRIPSLENCIFESMLTPLIFQVATKGLAMDAHWVTLKDICHHSEECTKVGMRKKCTYQSPLEGRH